MTPEEKRAYQIAWFAAHPGYQREWYQANYNRKLHRNAKRRASLKGVPFDLKFEDIVVPETCPVFGFPLVVNSGTIGFDSPTLDEIIPGKGYVLGNIQVISHKANSMKQNATPEELQRFADWINNGTTT